MTNPDIGILLSNIGSPEQPTPLSVKSYLRKFLSDPRVVEIPRFLWWPILHGIILQTRPKRSAKLYEMIWTEQGSPLSFLSEQIANKLSNSLKLPVEIGMHYGNPSIKVALEKLRSQHVKKIVVLPMFPQYSGTTTAATMDQISAVLKTWRVIPEIRTIRDYADDMNYINAMCHSISKHTIKHLLFSFHGIPQRCVDRGDPYQQQCLHTAQLIASKLKLPYEQWSVAFQSRLGRAQWLTPYTDKRLKELPLQGITDIHVVCPGFPVDCLETLEEIAIRAKEQFFKAGGKSFQYIPALNDTDEHLSFLQKLISQNILGWREHVIAEPEILFQE